VKAASLDSTGNAFRMCLPRPRCAGRGRKEAAGAEREEEVAVVEGRDAEEEREQKKENEGRGWTAVEEEARTMMKRRPDEEGNKW